MSFLPINKLEMEKSGIIRPDFVYVCGDAYVDHPSFGAAIICRTLTSLGYSVCFLSQPDWKNPLAFKEFGEPRLGFLVSAGNIDSMVNHYTVAKKKRQKDNYSPGGKMGLRPNRATIVYCNKIREVYKRTPIIIGGIEASLRRLSHYDYWDNNVRRSILLDSGADLLLYGMGENTIVEVASALNSGVTVSEINYIRGTVYKTKDISYLEDYIVLPKFQEVVESKKKYNESFIYQYENTDSKIAKGLIEEYKEAYIVQNPPTDPISTKDFDKAYSLPYMRTYHPIYEKDGGVPAIEEVKFSIISNRGCFGNCNFCALAFHQGRVVSSRSHNSIISEAEKITWDKDFKGYIHDVGGPTANFRHPACKKQETHGACKNKQCLFPNPCKALEITHKDYVLLLRKLRELPRVKKVFVRSGVRYDYAIFDKEDTFFKELCEHHVSGQLKVAPEHISPRVLEKMGKPQKEVYDKFVKKYYDINKRLKKEQYLVPYLMSSHPGSDIRSAIELAEYLRDNNQRPEQVQDFYPTPGTLSTCMYYTEVDPRDGKKVYVAKSPHEKAMQRALIQYTLPQNYDLVLEALKKAKREDLIGFGAKCLIRPKKAEKPIYKPKDISKTSNKKKKTIRNVHKASKV